MRIISHKLAETPFKAAQSAGGRLPKPTLILVHDTAGRLEKGSSVSWFLDSNCNTSAHVVVERDGSATQLVAFDTVAFHAGRSEWKGRSGCNAFAIGIEISNPGKLDKDGRAWFHKKTEKGFDVSTLKSVTTKEHGAGLWMDYTPEQIKTVTEICAALVAAYPSIEDVPAHYVVSPGRKIDTNPLFPLDAVRKAAFSVRGADAVAALPVMQPETVKPVTAVKAVTESKSLIAILIAGVQLAVSNFTDWMHQAWDFMLWVMGVLPKITAEVKTTLTSSEEVSKYLQLDWKTISVTVALATLAVVFIRHFNDKRRLAANG